MPYQQFLEQAAETYARTGHPLAGRLGAPLLAAGGKSAEPVEADIPAPDCLPAALASPAAHPIVEAIAAFGTDLPWQVAPSLQSDPRTCDRHAFVELVGPDGLAISDELRFGLYLQAPDTLYPPHRHAAEELYFVVSGTAEWQKDDAPFAPREPGTLIHHVPWQDHATTTHGEPLLAMWAWFGDLNPQSYRMAVEKM